MQRPIIVGITGASGVVYAVRLIDVLLTSRCEVHLVISPSGRDVIMQEMNRSIDLEKFCADQL
jgi:4-hydroxy-3-polyprenylbenzoate decarboxylase